MGEKIFMGEKKESVLSDNIQIWMHNEAEAQKTTEESLQNIPNVFQMNRSGSKS
jgi:hypothetical protein